MVAPTACKRTVSGSVSLPCSGFFSPFPHGTCSLSVSQEYLALADGAAGFRQDSSGPALLRVPLRLNCLPVRASHPLRTAFPDRSRSQYSTIPRPYYPGRAVTPPVWARPSSIASTKGFTVVFSSSGYLDVSVHRVRPALRGNAISCIGLPHSDIPGSKVICTSPELFAACHVFLRLLKPRHPPSALVHFLCLMSFIVGRHIAASCVRALTHTAC